MILDPSKGCSQLSFAPYYKLCFFKSATTEFIPKPWK